MEYVVERALCGQVEKHDRKNQSIYNKTEGDPGAFRS